jgi:ATP-dependent protease ClpP protease subunit
MGDLSDRLVAELIDAVRAQLRREQAERQRDVYLIGDIEKDTARLCIERLRELSNDSQRPISLYINSAGGAAAQHLERLKQMQDQIYKILSSRSGKPLRQIIRDTKRTDFYLDAASALDYGLVDGIVAGQLPSPQPATAETADAAAVSPASSGLNLVQPAAKENS